MDIGKLLIPARKKLIINDEGDFVTLKLWPIKIRYQIQKLRLKGIDIARLKDLQDKDDLEKIQLMGDDFDSGFEYKVKALEWGVNDDNHSFLEEGRPIKLNKEFWEKLSESNEKLFEKILLEVENYQSEMTLGEAIKNTSATS